MTDYTDKCIVLSISDYRDDDRLLRALTLEHGLVTVLMRGVKKAKAKLKPFAQMFAVFDARLVGKGAFLTAVEPMLIQDGFSLCADLKVFTAASVCAEATVAAVCDDLTHADMFLEFLRLLKSLITDADPYYAAAVYITRLLDISGFYREYTHAETPTTPQQLLGYCRTAGYGAGADGDLSRRALKYACAELARAFDIPPLKSVNSVDLYA